MLQAIRLQHCGQVARAFKLRDVGENRPVLQQNPFPKRRFYSQKPPNFKPLLIRSSCTPW